MSKNGLIPVNIMQEFEHSRTDTENQIPAYLPFHDIKQIIAAAKKYGGKYAKRDSAILGFFGYIGCRREEGESRNFEHINFFDNSAVLRRNKNNTVDIVEMHPELRKLLFDYYKEWKQRERREPLPNEPLFYGKKSSRISMKDINRLFLKYSKLAGINREFNITPRVFRTSFV